MCAWRNRETPGREVRRIGTEARYFLLGTLQPRRRTCRFAFVAERRWPLIVRRSADAGIVIDTAALQSRTCAKTGISSAEIAETGPVAKQIFKRAGLKETAPAACHLARVEEPKGIRSLRSRWRAPLRGARTPGLRMRHHLQASLCKKKSEDAGACLQAIELRVSPGALSVAVRRLAPTLRP